MRYTVKEDAAKHTCWDDDAWDGTMMDGCLGCDEAEANPCEFCGYGHGFTTHNPEAHDEGDGLDGYDESMLDYADVSVLTDGREMFDYTDVWVNSPHVYTTSEG